MNPKLLSWAELLPHSVLTTCVCFVYFGQIPTDSQPLELNMNRDLRPDTVTRTPPLVTDSLSNLAMLFEYHHQSSYRSRHVVGTAVRPLDDLDDRIVMGVALDHVNL